MDFNLFNWIRDGVKKSVLLGVSDAVDEIGVPEGDNTFHERIQSIVAVEEKKTGGKRQRRLGRSLKDLNKDAA